MAILGKEITMKILSGTGSSATDLITGLCIRDVGDFSATAGKIDATCHGSSNIKKSIKGLIELGDLTVLVDYKDAATSQALWTELVSGTSRTIKIIEKTNPGETTNTVDVLKFSGHVSGISETHPLEDVIRTTLTITPDGDTVPEWTTETEA